MLGMAIPGDAQKVVEAVFACCRDGANAGTIGLYGPDRGEWWLTSESFLWKHQIRITEGLADTLKDLLGRPNVEQLFALDDRFAPFFCPKCRAVYCGKCYRLFYVWDDDDPGFLDEVRGRCPAGHERTLSD